MAEPTHKQLVEMVVGKNPKGDAVFFEKAVLDHAKSQQAGRRVYTTKVYIQVTQQGVSDVISYLAQPADIEAWPVEYARFEETRQGNKQSPGVAIIPNLPLEHMQELIDIGCDTIEALVYALDIPKHLYYAQRKAMAIHTVLEEQDHAQEENHSEESRAEDVPAADRREYPRLVGRRDVPEGGGSRTEAAEELRPSRRPHGGPSLKVNQLDNWSIEFPA